jgi:hypothetical protein
MTTTTLPFTFLIIILLVISTVILVTTVNGCTALRLHNVVAIIGRRHTHRLFLSLDIVDDRGGRRRIRGVRHVQIE